MKTITSRDNALVKHVRALATSNRRQKREGQALLEGPHLARAYLDALGQPALCFATQASLQIDEVRALVERVEPARTVILADALFAQISTLVHGVALLLVIDVPVPSWPPAVDQTSVVLDGVQDAGNVGSILRSAAAAGVRRVFCTPGTASAWSSKVVRAGMGAHFSLEIFEEVEAARLAPLLAAPVVITELHDARPLDEQDLTGPVVWVFGNEGAGVAQTWRALAAHRVTIPQPGGLESLNVAAAAAVCLFEQCRQQRAARQ